MRLLFYTFVFLNLVSCNKEDAWECIQTSGTIISQEIEIDPFDRILVNRDIELVIKQGLEYKVKIQTGQNLLDAIEVVVVDNQLQLSDHNGCNLTRDYGLTKMTVTTPTLKEIRSNTQYLISSEGVLNFENLTLLCEDYLSDYFSQGDFKITTNTQTLRIVANNSSIFTISGFTETLSVVLASGTCQFNGADLNAQHVTVFQRSSHDIIVNPQQSLEGEIRSVGNVISVRTPPIVNVEQYYSGQLLFLD